MRASETRTTAMHLWVVKHYFHASAATHSSSATCLQIAALALLHTTRLLTLLCTLTLLIYFLYPTLPFSTCVRCIAIPVAFSCNLFLMVKRFKSRALAEPLWPLASAYHSPHRSLAHERFFSLTHYLTFCSLHVCVLVW